MATIATIAQQVPFDLYSSLYTVAGCIALFIGLSKYEQRSVRVGRPSMNNDRSRCVIERRMHRKRFMLVLDRQYSTLRSAARPGYVSE